MCLQSVGRTRQQQGNAQSQCKQFGTMSRPDWTKQEYACNRIYVTYDAFVCRYFSIWWRVYTYTLYTNSENMLWHYVLHWCHRHLQLNLVISDNYDSDKSKALLKTQEARGPEEISRVLFSPSEPALHRLLQELDDARKAHYHYLLFGAGCWTKTPCFIDT